MANTLYDYCRQRFLESQINWMTDTVKVSRSLTCMGITA